MKLTNIYLLHTTTTLTQSFFAQCQIERLLLSIPFKSFLTFLIRKNEHPNFVSWKMNHQTPSKSSLSMNPSTISLFHQKTKEHRVNSVECAIIYEKSFHQWSCSIDQNFSIHLWEQLFFLKLKTHTIGFIYHVMTHMKSCM